MFSEIVRHRCSREWPRALLGALFMTTGIAKIPVLREFTVAIEEMIGTGATFSFPVAAGVILLEIAIGGALLLGIRTALAGFGALTMAGIFAGFQGGRLVFGVEIPCYCLGVVGPGLPHWSEPVLDIFLLFLSIVVIRRADRAGLPEGVWSWRHAWLAVIVPAGFVSLPLALERMPTLSPDQETVLQKVRAEKPAADSGKEIVLCLSLDEFHCSLCFDDLVALLDSLQRELPGVGRVAVAAVLRSEESADSTGWRLRRWARETGVSGPVVVLHAGEFDEATGGGSALWITRGMERILQSWELPLGERGRREVLAALKGGR
jgi:hypothetical protein